jgi:hypothetical protein
MHTQQMPSPELSAIARGFCFVDPKQNPLPIYIVLQQNKIQL